MDNVHTNDMLNGMLNTFLAMPVALDFTLVSKVSEFQTRLALSSVYGIIMVC